jgi:DNA mismatch endonuclease (patch repair protein)
MVGAPPATSQAVRRVMQGNHRAETRPERRLRAALHSMGFRFRKDRRLRAGDRWVRPDIVFGPTQVAVFVDGCFWHRCPSHSTQPRVNTEYWEAKFARNIARDRADDSALAAKGWTVVRIWEHEAAESAARRVAALVRAAREQFAADQR